MTKQTEALKLALEALEHCKDVIIERGLNGNPEFAKKWELTLPLERSEKAITALREALAEQPAQQEPVVFCMHWEDRWGCNHYADPKEPHPINSKPLYTSPPAQRTSPQAERAAWVGLTRAECLQIEKDMMKYYDYQHECKTVCLPEFSRAIEAKLKEKNT